MLPHPVLQNHLEKIALTREKYCLPLISCVKQKVGLYTQIRRINQPSNREIKDLAGYTYVTYNSPYKNLRNRFRLKLSIPPALIKSFC